MLKEEEECDGVAYARYRAQLVTSRTCASSGRFKGILGQSSEYYSKVWTSKSCAPVRTSRVCDM